MDALFWLRLGLSFLIGSAWVTLTTLSAERLGSKAGGLIGGMPSTVVIALLFIGLTQSPHVAAQATTVMPVAQGLNGLFVITFMLLIPYGMRFALPGAFGVWLAQSALLYILNLQVFWVSLLAWIILLGICYLVVEKWMNIPSLGRVKVSYSLTQAVSRALFGGLVITLAVFMGKVGGPLLGGILGSFPAMFLSTLVITSQSAGPGFSRSVGKSMLISGLINVPLYEIAVRFLYPALGLMVGTLLSLLISVVSGWLTYRFMKSRLS